MADHEHSHGGEATTNAILVALDITSTIAGVEIVAAVMTGSLTIMMDAGHMFVDSFGLVVALVAAKLHHRPAIDTLTWGFKRAEYSQPCSKLSSSSRCLS